MATNQTFTRKEVEKILNRFSFFLSDNGDDEITGKEYMDIYYPEKEE